jgi:hypothetical protein
MTENGFELTDEEIEAMINEEKAIQSATPIVFLPVKRGDEPLRVAVMKQSDLPETLTGFKSFWMAYAECARLEGNQTQFSYGLKMSKTKDEPIYNWKDFADSPKPEYPAYQ